MIKLPRKIAVVNKMLSFDQKKGPPFWEKSGPTKQNEKPTYS
jgi:hypothetical protein